VHTRVIYNWERKRNTRRRKEKNMSFEGRGGSKVGAGGLASASQTALDRRERLRRLALETIDLSKDPYFMRNHLGSYECKLCLTIHGNEGNYLAHTQGKRHQQNLAKRAAREASETKVLPQQKNKVVPRKRVTTIGRPGYRVTKQFDARSRKRSLLFQIEYPEHETNVKPTHRFMSSYEQKVEPWDKKYQYVVFACDPYETIAFKIPNVEIATRGGGASRGFSGCQAAWEEGSKTYACQVFFENSNSSAAGGLPPPPPGGGMMSMGGIPPPPPPPPPPPM
jgi:splicing factor 3A subunit 2